MLVFQLRSQLREENKIKTVMLFQLYLSKVTHSSHPYISVPFLTQDLESGYS